VGRIFSAHETWCVAGFPDSGEVDALEAASSGRVRCAGSETNDPDGWREPDAETLAVTKRPDPIDSFEKALGTLATLITAITGAALAGHNIGWW
jgi:hypothetical protein